MSQTICDEPSLRPLSDAEVLDRAADLIEPDGAWIQGALAGDDDGNFYHGYAAGDGKTCWCAIGALARVTGDADTTRIRRRVENHLGLGHEPSGDGGWPLAEWNDHPDRTQAEVVAALRQAAESARKDGSSPQNQDTNQ